ncbi:hypothetical protein AB0L49_37295 [Streptomyces antimycoticus]|uniref:hypothetical protein n=1 Tax=Streptomyces antimycoticus TaxID=68175 RepID=UPI0034378ECA
MKTKKHAPTAVATSSGRPSGRRWRASAAMKETGVAVALRTVGGQPRVELADEHGQFQLPVQCGRAPEQLQ